MLEWFSALWALTTCFFTDTFVSSDLCVSLLVFLCIFHCIFTVFKLLSGDGTLREWR